MGQGDAVPHAGRAEVLTLLQRGKGGGGVQSIGPGDDVAQILEQTLLAGNVRDHLDGGRPKDTRKLH